MLENLFLVECGNHARPNEENRLFGYRTTTCWETVGPGIRVVVTATHTICVNAADQVRGLCLHTAVLRFQSILKKLQDRI